MKFNLPSNKSNEISIVLVNYSFRWCSPCKDEFNEVAKLSGIFKKNFIQVQLSNEDQVFDKNYYDQENNTKDFDTKLLNAEGALPSIFLYKGDIFQKSIIGFAELQEILTAIEGIK